MKSFSLFKNIDRFFGETQSESQLIDLKFFDFLRFFVLIYIIFSHLFLNNLLHEQLILCECKHILLLIIVNNCMSDVIRQIQNPPLHGKGLHIPTYIQFCGFCFNHILYEVWLKWCLNYNNNLLLILVSVVPSLLSVDSSISRIKDEFRFVYTLLVELSGLMTIISMQMSDQILLSHL